MGDGLVRLLVVQRVVEPGAEGFVVDLADFAGIADFDADEIFADAFAEHGMGAFAGMVAPAVEVKVLIHISFRPDDEEGVVVTYTAFHGGFGIGSACGEMDDGALGIAARVISLRGHFSRDVLPGFGVAEFHRSGWVVVGGVLRGRWGKRAHAEISGAAGEFMMMLADFWGARSGRR